MALYQVPLGNSGPREVSSLISCPEQAQPRDHISTISVRAGNLPGNKQQQHLGPGPTFLMGKHIPLSPASLTLLSLLPRALPNPTGITAGALPAWDRAEQCSCLSCVGALWPPSGPSPSAWDIWTSIIILLAVTEFIRTSWCLLEAKLGELMLYFLLHVQAGKCMNESTPFFLQWPV